jgi:hypothetical protein
MQCPDVRLSRGMLSAGTSIRVIDPHEPMVLAD